MWNSAAIRGALCAGLGILFATALNVAPASAQATRTWVSGVGDDANPCSRTAPCKTFAGAISKTAAGGEIDALDPGGFGAITITKSITLNGGTGAGFASVLVSGTNGINVAAGPSDVVVLRHLEVQGIGSGLIGIRITGAGTVHIEDVLVAGMAGRAISDERSATGLLFIKDTIVRNNSNGVVLVPAAGTLKATIENVRADSNISAGFTAATNSFVTIRNSEASGNGNGFVNQTAAGDMNLENCIATSNGIGVQNGTGGASTTRLSNTAIFENTTGIQNVGGQMLSYGNNKIGGNTGGNTGVTAASPGQQ